MGRSAFRRERILSSTRIYKGGLINLRLDEVELTDGDLLTREIIEHPGAVVVLPLVRPDRLVFVRQYREPAGKVLVELPAGTLRGGERPIDCALRELCEETGYTAAKMRRMFSCYLAPGYSNELIHAFLARELTKGEASPEPNENLRMVRATLKQALGMIERGEIRDAKTIAAVLWFVQFAIKPISR